MNVFPRLLLFAFCFLFFVGCNGQYATYTPSAADLTTIAEQMPEGPTKVAVQSTAVARYLAAIEAERTITAARAAENAAQSELDIQTAAMTAEAQSTITAQENIARATRSALDTRATVQALDALATTQAQSVQATATAESRNATATATAAIAQATATAEARAVRATAEMATATMQAAVDSVEKTRQASQAVILQATAHAVQRQDQMDETVQGVRTAAPWVGLLAIVITIIGLIIYFAPVVKARASVIRRKHDETEALYVTLEQIVAPARMFGPLLDLIGERAPQLAPPELQDRTTARAQLANVVSAAQGAGKRMAKRHPTAPATTTSSVIRVIEPEQARPWIQDARTQLIEQGVSDGNL
ncbi:MAG: hypothetical protein GY832_34660 [Chloroflexi bacterium]|nr:hypothetical protein [Chloroflexota bacterium]